MDHDIAARGLGRRGHYPIPPTIWHTFVPTTLMANIRTHEQGFDTLRKSCTPDTLTLLNRLLADGFLQPGHKQANCNMFVLPKTTEKCSLIADLRFLNKFSPDPLPRFVLPRLTDIADVIAHFPPGKLWATTLDLTNFYWSLVLPPEFWDVFMTPVGSYSTLPFGWNLAPILAQKTLEHFVWSHIVTLGLLPFFCMSFWVWVYLDDVFILSKDTLLLEYITLSLCAQIAQADLVLSSKSLLTPSQNLTWLGKRFDLRARLIVNLDKSFLKALGMGILSCLLPMSHSRLDNLLGTLNWVFHPIPGYLLFTGPWYQWRWTKGRRKTASLNLQTLLLDALILAFTGWRMPAITGHKLLVPLITVDAACIHDKFQVGTYSPLIGARLLQCPIWIASQQQAEYYGLICCAKLAISLGWHSVSIVGDNRASLFCFRKLKPFHGHWRFMKLLRGLFNRMLTKGLLVNLFWVPSALMPADPISRILPDDPVSRQQGLYDATNRFSQLMTCSHMMEPWGTVALSPDPAV